MNFGDSLVSSPDHMSPKTVPFRVTGRRYPGAGALFLIAGFAYLGDPGNPTRAGLLCLILLVVAGVLAFTGALRETALGILIVPGLVSLLSWFTGRSSIFGVLGAVFWLAGFFLFTRKSPGKAPPDGEPKAEASAQQPNNE